jgi:UDP-N-acetyl-D-mannosaminuronate dehydrogenase
VREWSVDGQPVEADEPLADAVASADLVILLQAHSTFDPDDIGRRARLLLDTRGVATAGECL